MKKKIISLILVAIAAVSLIACGKKADTGVVISASDNNVDTTGDAQAVSDDTANSKDSNKDGDKDVGAGNFIEDKTIKGAWYTKDGYSYFFSDDTFECVSENSVVVGSYETDSATYVKLTYTESTEDEQSDDTEDNNEEFEKLLEDEKSYVYLRYNSYYTEVVYTGEEEIEHKVDENGNEEAVLYNDDDVLSFAKSNKCDYVMIGYDIDNKVVGMAAYDPSDDISNTYDDEPEEKTKEAEVVEETTPKTIEITYTIKKGTTDDGIDILKLTSDKDEIILIRQ